MKKNEPEISDLLPLIVLPALKKTRRCDYVETLSSHDSIKSLNYVQKTTLEPIVRISPPLSRAWQKENVTSIGSIVLESPKAVTSELSEGPRRVCDESFSDYLKKTAAVTNHWKPVTIVQKRHISRPKLSESSPDFMLQR